MSDLMFDEKVLRRIGICLPRLCARGSEQRAAREESGQQSDAVAEAVEQCCRLSRHPSLRTPPQWFFRPWTDIDTGEATTISRSRGLSDAR